MDVELHVVNPGGDRETVFGDFIFSHAGCGPVQQHRNPATSELTLTCRCCGLELMFESMGDAHNSILDAVIDGEARPLPAGSYSSETRTAVRIVPRDAA
jgi:hypothetical protein